jgi:hypothetical protein
MTKPITPQDIAASKLARMNDIHPPRLLARLFTTDRVTVEVPDLPVPPPATAGKLKVDIPYPVSEQRRTVHRVAVINQDTGFIARSSIPLQVVDPGDTLTVEFGKEHVSRNRLLFDVAGFLGGDHLESAEQEPAEAADSTRLDAVAANLASLNEIVAEMTARFSDDPEFTTMVRELLRGHSHALGFRFQDDEGGS